ncbi:MAG: M48 family metallopeptidase [Parachlamydiaceae bacterium]|nr:M48 family metallopeptidase [Parachlamydiaceae bacterium]
MNFWEAQKRARSRTSLYVFLFIMLTAATALMSEIAMRKFAGESYEPQFPFLGIAFAGITFAVAGFQYLQYRTFGGSYVAESVGAHRVDSRTTNPKNRQLLNIVEEIATASSLPIPPVYILETPQINAFAAGLTIHDAAVTVTRGCLDLLNRDELQGVVAHEFGHIYNGDMKISLRLAAMVMGFFFVFYIAMRLLQFSPRNDDNRGGRGGGNPVLIAALILFIAGTFTWLFGSILKASVSREREYLADACAVQFTRNPDGIANALIKIGKSDTNSMPKEGMAFSHLYIDDRAGLSALFSTHPPLKKRIEAIKGQTYMPEEWKTPSS